MAPADGSAPARRLTSGSFEHHGVTWSPDGRRVAFVAARHENWDLTRAVDLFVMDADGGEPVCLTGTDLAYSNAVWSPDGATVAVHVSDERDTPRHSQIGLVDVDSGRLRMLTEELDRQCAPYGVANRNTDHIV